MLAVVLAVSGVAKWRNRDATRSAIRLLGLPPVLQTAFVAKALPVSEGALALALLLLGRPIAIMAAAAALILFLIYWVLVARAMTFKPRPTCGCFGSIGDQTIRGRTVVRNTLFVASAAVWLWATTRGASVPGLLAGLSTTGWLWLLGAALVAVVTVLVVGGGPKATGTPAPRPMTNAPSANEEFEDEDYVRVPTPHGLLVDAAGKPVTLLELSAQRAQLLIFANCYCGPTYAAWDLLKQWAPQLPAIDLHMVFAVVPIPEASTEYPTEGALYDHQGLTWLSLHTGGSPAAVLLGADGYLAGGPVLGVDEISEFFEEVADALRDMPAPPPQPATPTPGGPPVVSTGAVTIIPGDVVP